MNRSWMRPLAGLALALLVSAPSSRATGTESADGPGKAGVEGRAGEAARRQFMLGERLFRARRYRQAARAYERGYQLSRLPGFLVNLAHCQVRLGQLEPARRFYLAFLQEAPSSPRAADVRRALLAVESVLSQQNDGEPAAVPATAPVAALAGTPSPPLSSRDRPRQPGRTWPPPAPLPAAALGGAAPMAIAARAGDDDGPPRWVLPVTGGAVAALVAGTVTVFVLRSQKTQGVGHGSIGTLRR